MRTQPNLHRSLARSLSALLLFSAAACGSDGPTASPPIQPARAPVATVDLSATEFLVPAGEHHQLLVRLLAADGTELTGRAVAWESSDATVASVDASGRVTGHREGIAIVSATSEGKRDEARVQVGPPAVASVRLDAQTLSLVPGQTKQLTATVVGSNGAVLAGREVTWVSSDTGKAVVDATGLVTARRGGTVLVTAHAEGHEASVVVQIAMTANPDHYDLLAVEGAKLGQALARIDTTMWTDGQGVAHPAEVVVSGGSLAFVRGGEQLRYVQRLTLSTYLLDDEPGEIRFPVAERTVEDRGTVTVRPGGGFDYLFRSDVIPNNHVFFAHVIGVERLAIRQQIHGAGPERLLVFSQW